MNFASPHEGSPVKAIQRDYHDWEASNYDAKFSISYDQRCIDYAAGRFRRVVPGPLVARRVLEVGSGTGFFLLNLALGGHLDGAQLHASDVSSGMLEVCQRNALAHGLDVATTVADVEDLPFADDSFDLIVGHAFLHHLPVPGLALREIARVLAPGGTVVIAGEPTEVGSRITGAFKRTTAASLRLLDTARRRTGRPALLTSSAPKAAADPATEAAPVTGRAADEALAALEHVVDLHTFRPRDVEKMAVLAGLTDVRVVTEEFVASWFGWSTRTLEAMVNADMLSEAWPWRALRIYQRLQAVDEVVTAIVPAGWCYNVIVAGRKPVLPTAVRNHAEVRSHTEMRSHA